MTKASITVNKIDNLSITVTEITDPEERALKKNIQEKAPPSADRNINNHSLLEIFERSKEEKLLKKKVKMQTTSAIMTALTEVKIFESTALRPILANIVLKLAKTAPKIA